MVPSKNIVFHLVMLYDYVVWFYVVLLQKDIDGNLTFKLYH